MTAHRSLTGAEPWSSATAGRPGAENLEGTLAERDGALPEEIEDRLGQDHAGTGSGSLKSSDATILLVTT